MNILFLGFSSLVQRKVLPAALQSKTIETISIASSKALEDTVVPEKKRGRFFQDYEQGLKESDASLVYISFPNALHGPWVKKALEYGFHTIVDKPAFLHLEEAKRLTTLAKSKQLTLAEANVWTYHNLFHDIKGFLKDKKPQSVSANFSSPPLNPDNFRYDKDMGAGILMDRGSYVVSCVRELFNEPPVEVICRQSYSQTLLDVDITLSVFMRFSNNSTFMGFFSLESEYANMFEVIGKDFKLRVDRIFTPPKQLKLQAQVRQKNVDSLIEAEPHDTFQAFLEDVVTSIQDASYSKFNELLLQDAEQFERLLLATQH